GSAIQIPTTLFKFQYEMHFKSTCHITSYIELRLCLISIKGKDPLMASLQSLKECPKPTLFFVTIFVGVVLEFLMKEKLKKRTLNLPPTPAKWLIIGNLNQLGSYNLGGKDQVVIFTRVGSGRKWDHAHKKKVLVKKVVTRKMKPMQLRKDKSTII
ncbi:unnamed protein product, partial [Dovyalis caffra]